MDSELRDLLNNLIAAVESIGPNAFDEEQRQQTLEGIRDELKDMNRTLGGIELELQAKR